MATVQEIESAQKALNQWYLGKTSKHYESGTNGPAAISTGVGDHGGVSYGSYQLSTNMGTLKEYLNATNNYNGAFDGFKPKTAAFDQKWVELAKNDPKFHESQHDFIASKHYEPQKQALVSAGYDFSERGHAVQDMLWSTAVQYRGYTVSKIERAERESGLDFSKASDKEIITAVQDSKYKHYKEDFQSSSKQWKGISNRILDEKTQLLKLVGHEEISKQQDMGITGSDLYNPQHSLNKAGSIDSDLKATVLIKTTAAVNDLCDARGYPNHAGRDNMACYLANDLIAQGAQGKGKFEAALHTDGKTISVREQISEFKDFIASADSNVIVNIPKAESLAKIAAYEPLVIAQADPSQMQQVGRSL